MIMKKHSLAGTCGIPTEDRRIYIPVDVNGTDDPDRGPSDPVTITGPTAAPGRSSPSTSAPSSAAPSSTISACATTSASQSSAKRSGGSTATGSSSVAAAWR